MNFISLTGGTAGDINPLISLGTELVKLGHQFTIGANDYFQKVIESKGLQFFSTGDSRVYEDMVAQPNNWDSNTDILHIWEEYLIPHIDRYLKNLNEMQLNKDTILINTVAMLPFRIARELFKVPLITVGLSPYQFLDVHKNNDPKNKIRTQNLIATINSYINLHSSKKYEIKNIDKFKFSPDANIGLWPEWFIKPELSWPIETTHFLVEDGKYSESYEVENIIDKNPILVTGGSGIRSTHMFEAAIRATEELRMPLFIVTPKNTDLPPTLPAHVLYSKGVSFSKILPHCRLLIHPGGVGTTARGLMSGIQQLFTPYTTDHFQNARATEKLNMGLSWYKKDNMTEKIKSLLSKPKNNKIMNHFNPNNNKNVALKFEKVSKKLIKK